MRIKFHKYHALENDFLVIDDPRRKMTAQTRTKVARNICNRRRSIGADGVLCISKSTVADARIDINNADGGWAEKSGNGLRIAALHLKKSSPRKKKFSFETITSVDDVLIGNRTRRGYLITADLGRPSFDPRKLPVRTKKKILLNSPLKFGTVKLPVTCLSVGNPHTILIVKDFEFDWQQLGSDLEHSAHFPRGTNVEFVVVESERRLQLAEWERGAGATGSSGTGAAAAVCAMVMLGLAKRMCKVSFETGTLDVNWRSEDDIVEVKGPVEFITEGVIDL